MAAYELFVAEPGKIRPYCVESLLAFLLIPIFDSEQIGWLEITWWHSPRVYRYVAKIWSTSLFYLAFNVMMGILVRRSDSILTNLACIGVETLYADLGAFSRKWVHTYLLALPPC